MFSVFNFGWIVNFGVVCDFDHQGARGNEGGDFGVAKFFEEAEDVAIDGFGVEGFSGLKITGDGGGLDTGVNGCGVKGEEAAFAVAEEADGEVVGDKGIDGGEDFLGFVSDDMATQFISGSVDEFAVRLVVH